jgi:hypothetical protein
MPRKKSRKKKQPNLRSRIVSLLVAQGPMKLRNMRKILGSPYKSLNTEALELRKRGVLEKDEEGTWSLVYGIDPEDFGIEVISGDKDPVQAGVSTSTVPPIDEPGIGHKERFRRLLLSVGIKNVDPSLIVDLFFNGDIHDPNWLYQILTIHAKGYFSEKQARLVMASWTYYWHGKDGFEFYFKE